MILGRASVIVLLDYLRALRVRFGGPPERRIEQAMRLAGIDEQTAERRMRQLDHAHDACAQHLYGGALSDPSLTT